MTQDFRDDLNARSRHWLVTGSAGFIGSHLLETLLLNGQQVTSLDNFSTGYRANLDDVAARVGRDAWSRHRFIEGDIRDLGACRRACRGVEFVLHQAALGSVPRSIDNPLLSHDSNVNGFLNMLVAARDEKVKRFVFAGSSATYGDHPALPKLEDQIGESLSPYAVTKHINELYARVFGRCYGFPWMALRYFNVFGPRQDPNGAYAAVIPRWTQALVDGGEVVINGDGETSRDFCYIANTVQANLRAAMTEDPAAIGKVYNVAVGERTNLNDLYAMLREFVAVRYPERVNAQAIHGAFRGGDVRHSLADIKRAVSLLGYAPTHRLREGLRETVQWFLSRETAAANSN